MEILMRRVHLSIPNFRRTLRVLIEIGVFCGFMIGLEKIWEYFIYDDTMEEARTVMFDFYHQEKIDNLFLGCSHVYFDLNPELMNEYTGEVNFNLSTPLQPMAASYYLLKEADKLYDIGTVYLEMFYGVSLQKAGILYSWRVYDYMPLSINKLEFMTSTGDARERYLGFFRARRMWQNALDIEKMGEIWEKKCGENYRAHKWIKVNERGVEYFQPGGYVYTEYEMEEDPDSQMEEVIQMGEKPLSKEAEKYLRKILDYCRARKIRIILYMSPLTAYARSGYVGHEYYLEQINEIAGEYGTKYYDFNLCKKDFLDLGEKSYWRDKEHLNIWGAERFTKTFYDIVIRQSAVDKEKYFYPCYEDE